MARRPNALNLGKQAMTFQEFKAWLKNNQLEGHDIRLVLVVAGESKGYQLVGHEGGIFDFADPAQARACLQQAMELIIEGARGADKEHSCGGKLVLAVCEDMKKQAERASQEVFEQMDENDKRAAMTGKLCPTCNGCGLVANDDQQTPWNEWASLPVGGAGAAVVLGLVRPLPCPQCGGSGRIGKHQYPNHEKNPR